MSGAARGGTPIGRLIGAIERSPHGIGWSFALVLSSCFARAFLEGAFESSRQLGFALEPLQSQLMVFLHLPAFFISLFLLIALAVHAATREPVDRIVKAVAAGSPVIVLPVVVDALVSGTGYQLYYLTEPRQVTEYLLFTFAPWRPLPGASPGIRIEVAVGCLAGGLYAWEKTRSLFRAALSAILVFLSCVLAGALPLAVTAAWSALSGGMAALSSVFGPGGLVPTDTRKYALLFLSLATGLGLLLFRLGDRHGFRAFFAAARPLRTVHYAGMVGLGFLAGWLTVGRAYPQAFANPFDYLFLPGAMAAVAACFQSAVLLNDLFDRDIDRMNGKPNPLAAGTAGEGRVLRWAAGCAALALAFAAVLHQSAVLIVLFLLALSASYSAPPLRLRRYYPLSVLLIALAALAASWLGFSAFGGARTLELFPHRLGWFIMVCFGLSFATKDLNDVAGDRQAGIITLPVLLGERAGKAVTACLVLVAYLAGPLILGVPWLLAAAIPAGTITAWLVLRPRVREGLVFLIYFLYGAAVAAALWSAPATLGAPGQAERHGRGREGIDLFLGKRYAQAAPLLRQASAGSADPQLLWPLARSLYEIDSISAAAAAVQRLLEHDPLSERAHHLAGRIALRAGDPEAAARAYRHAAGLGVAPGSFHGQLGELLRRQGKLTAAETEFHLAVAAAGPQAGPLAGLARIRLAQRDTAAAAVLLRRALRRDPGSGDANACAGGIAMARGDYAGAVAHLELANAADPRRPDLLNDLGLARQQLGDWQGAEAAFLAAVAAAPESPPAWVSLARLYVAIGDPQRAAAALARSGLSCGAGMVVEP